MSLRSRSLALGLAAFALASVATGTANASVIPQQSESTTWQASVQMPQGDPCSVHVITEYHGYTDNEAMVAFANHATHNLYNSSAIAKEHCGAAFTVFDSDTSAQLSIGHDCSDVPPEGGPCKKVYYISKNYYYKQLVQ
ncbi:hypothetical protein OG985_47860 [Streptomyces sp. NBC_00289]|uniref:hypothetical protein n=1 Tax=Streptomyces sp. NBC_00289 TaxID=2975703 RepID=UPI0032507F08